MAGVETTTTETQYAGHCEDAARDLDISNVDLIISVSGDGMLHEMINGIMKRDDWHKATKITLGVIPCGTGNALASSLMYPSPIISILTLIKRQWRPFDLMAAYQYSSPDYSSSSLQNSSADITASIDTTASSPNPARASSSNLSSSVAPSTTSSENEETLTRTSKKTIITSSAPTPTSASSKPSKKSSKKALKNEKEKSDGTSVEMEQEVGSKISEPTSKSSKPNSSLKSHQKALSADSLVRPNEPAPTASNASSSSPKPVKHSQSSSKLYTKSAIARQQRREATKPGSWNLVCYSFQALMWGIISDVDIETEPWRWMGDFRFTVGVLRRIAALRRYPARLLTLDSETTGDHMSICQFHSVCDSCSDGRQTHYDRHEKLEKHFSDNETKIEVTVVEERTVTEGNSILAGEKSVFTLTGTEEVTDKPPRRKKKKNVESSLIEVKAEEIIEKVAEEVASEAAVEEAIPEVKQKSRRIKSKEESVVVATQAESEFKAENSKSKRKKSKKALKEVEEIEECSVSKSVGEEHSNSSKLSLLATNASLSDNIGTKDSKVVMNGLAKGLENLIDFDPMQVDAEIDRTRWSELNTKFVYFVASNVSHIGTDLRVAPYAHTCGGTVDIIYAEDMPKVSLIDMVTSLEKGRYVSHSTVTYKKAKAFVLIPTGKPGVIDLDGEEYEPVPTAIEVHTGVLRMCVAIWNMTLPE